VSAHLGYQLAFMGMALMLFVGNVVFQILGWRFARARSQGDEQATAAGRGAIEASVFALLGLLVALSFSGAESRLMARRDLIVREAGAIETAYLHLAILPEPARRQLKGELQRYLDARLAFYDTRLDKENLERQRARANQLKQEIWADALRAAEQASDQRVLSFVLPPLNEMFNLKIAREAALRAHVPLIIFVFLGVLSFACAFVAGKNMAGAKRPSPLHVLLFAGTMAFTAFIILNVEFPRAGFIAPHSLDQPLIELRATMS
jgi:hypothetical protein